METRRSLTPILITIKKRRIEIITSEYEPTVVQVRAGSCPLCRQTVKALPAVETRLAPVRSMGFYQRLKNILLKRGLFKQVPH
jgi:hypothetical protein